MTLDESMKSNVRVCLPFIDGNYTEHRTLNFIPFGERNEKKQFGMTEKTHTQISSSLRFSVVIDKLKNRKSISWSHLGHESEGDNLKASIYDVDENSINEIEVENANSHQTIPFPITHT